MIHLCVCLSNKTPLGHPLGTGKLPAGRLWFYFYSGSYTKQVGVAMCVYLVCKERVNCEAFSSVSHHSTFSKEPQIVQRRL